MNSFSLVGSPVPKYAAQNAVASCGGCLESGHAESGVSLYNTVRGCYAGTRRRRPNAIAGRGETPRILPLIAL